MLSLWEAQRVLSGSRRREGWANAGVASVSAPARARQCSRAPSPQVALLETNPYLLALTIIVSIVHSVFEFLAFKNGRDRTLGSTRGQGGRGQEGARWGDRACPLPFPFLPPRSSPYLGSLSPSPEA